MTKSQEIISGLREGFKNGTTKMADRACYGYVKASGGRLTINNDEAVVIRWIFRRYLTGDSLGKIVNGLAKEGIHSPTGKARWNSEAIHKLLSNEKYIGNVLLQKTVSVCGRQFSNDGVADKVLYSNNHPAIISRKLFDAVQSEKSNRSRKAVDLKQDMSL